MLFFLLYTHPFPLTSIPTPEGVAAAFETEWPYGEATGWFGESVGWYTKHVSIVERAAVDWTATHLFGFDDTLDRPFGSGDPTYAYIQLLLYVVLALSGAALWTFLDRRRRRANLSLAGWLQIGARFYLAFTLFGYGFAKLFPSQFRFPGLGRLVTPYGEGSPMNVLWSFMGSSDAYIVFSGAAEVLAGLLLCFRRTATAGALATVAVMTNVAAMNYCYDVPVKLFSTVLLLFAACLCLPDLRRLLAVFLLNRAAEARDLSRPRLPYFGHFVKLLVVGTTLVVSTKRVVDRYTAEEQVIPLHGIWDVASFSEGGAELPPLTTDPRRWNALLVESAGFGRIQAMDGSLRGTALAFDEEAATLTLSTKADWSYALEGDELVLLGEFTRQFRADPMEFEAKAEPRDPQVRVVLRRATEPDLGEGETATPPATFSGRWTVERDELIGEVATRRRTDPTGWIAVRFGEDESATFEFADGSSADYSFAVDAEASSLTLPSSATLELTQPEAGALLLTGDYRGHAVDIELALRDLDSFLLVRRGFNWINEIPLNRY